MQGRRDIRIFYIAASGNLVAAYRSWKSGVDVESEVAKTYSGSIFDFVKKHEIEGAFVSANQKIFTVDDGLMCVKNVKIPEGGRGIKFYVNWILGSIDLLKEVFHYKPEILLVSDRRIFFPLLFIAKIRKIKIVNVMHVAFYSELKSPKGLKKILLKLDAIFLRWGSDYLLGVSDDIIDQSRYLCSEKAPMGASFSPQWNRDGFDKIFDSRPPDDLFSVSFLGRIERNKGVFDLLRAFVHLRAEGHRLKLDFLGEGSALGELREEIARLGLSDLVSTHGHCSGEQVIAALAQTHIVVVPTRSEFVEGLNKVAIEAVLSGRPVVTSQVCQALSLIREAAFEATPDDWMSYAQCIEHAMTDPAAYDKAVAAAGVLRERFFDPSRSIGHMLEKAFVDMGLLQPGERGVERG